MNRQAAALQAYGRAVELGADPAQVDFALAAFGAEGSAMPDAAPQPYVVQLFDSVAGDFDQHLNDTLKYRVPQLLAEALARCGGLPAGASVLDLGCGTGLAGALLRPQAARLEGVDLSPGMLEQARRRGIYDALACGDIVEHLEALSAPVDLVLAADVFVYLGDLAPVFAASAAALRPGGLFAFSVEALGAAAGVDFLLCRTRRYAHALDYVLRLTAAHGFEVALLEAAVLREEGGADVAGGIVVLRR
jgi:predicted TPR repeat methyltransferase